MSWYQLLDIRKQARQEWRNFWDRPPTACPRCGEPLLADTTGGESGTLRCKFDGYQYPRDFIRPNEPAGLFGGARDESSSSGSHA